MQRVLHFNKSERQNDPYEQLEVGGAPRLKYDPATTPADCRADNVHKHHHYFTDGQPRFCSVESEMRQEKMDKYLKKLPLKQAMKKAREDDQKRLQYNSDDKLFNRLKMIEPGDSPYFKWLGLNERSLENYEYYLWRRDKNLINLPYPEFMPITRVDFDEDLPEQPKYASGAHFSGKVVHIESPQKFFVIPNNEPEGKCDGGLVDHPFFAGYNTENFSHLIASQKGSSSDVKFENISSGLSYVEEDSGISNPTLPVFPSLGEKDKLLYYSKPGYLDLYRRDIEARDIQEQVLAKKIAHSWRIDFYENNYLPGRLPNRFSNIANERFCQPDIPEYEKEEMRQTSKLAFFPEKVQVTLYGLTLELSDYFDKVLESTESRSCCPSLFQYKARYGYAVDEVVAVYVEFEMLPVERVLYGYGISTRKEETCRRGWLRGRIVQVEKSLDYVDTSLIKSNVPAPRLAMYRVSLLDYGATVIVNDQFILRLPRRFAQQHPMAYKCSLFTVSPTGTEWSSKETEFFLELVSTKHLSISVACGTGCDTGSEALKVFMNLQNAYEFTDVGKEMEKAGMARLECVFHQEFQSKLSEDYGLTQEELWTFRAFYELNGNVYSRGKPCASDEDEEGTGDKSKGSVWTESGTFCNRIPEHKIDWELGSCLKAKADKFPAWADQWHKYGTNTLSIKYYDRSLYEKPHKVERLNPEEKEKRMKKYYDEQRQYFLQMMTTRFKIEEEKQETKCLQRLPSSSQYDVKLGGDFYYEWRERQQEKQLKKYNA